MKYVIGNWKSNQNLSQSLMWLDDVKAIKPQIGSEKKVVVCLPFTDIASFNQKATELGLDIQAGAQNVSAFPPGKYTGEINAQMLGELVTFCLVGHYERRTEFSENSQTIANKAVLLLENSITPIICLDKPYIEEQIKSLISQDVDLSRCLFVYEPSESIGTGNASNLDDVNHIAHQISFLTDNSSPVLYGGSITPENVKSFINLTSVSGVLVGSESLSPYHFCEIINIS